MVLCMLLRMLKTYRSECRLLMITFVLTMLIPRVTIARVWCLVVNIGEAARRGAAALRL